MKEVPPVPGHRLEPAAALPGVWVAVVEGRCRPPKQQPSQGAAQEVPIVAQVEARREPPVPGAGQLAAEGPGAAGVPEVELWLRVEPGLGGGPGEAEVEERPPDVEAPAVAEGEWGARPVARARADAWPVGWAEAVVGVGGQHRPAAAERAPVRWNGARPDRC